MAEDRDKTPAPTSPMPNDAAPAGRAETAGTETSEGGLPRQYLKDVRAGVDSVYKKDKDLDERALGSDEGHRSLAPELRADRA